MRSRAAVMSRRTGAAAMALGSVALVALALVAAPARGQDGTVIRTHGYSTFGDLKYPENFAHFDYVNPDPPKGGEISTWAQGTFDNFNPYTRKGRPAALANLPYESILDNSADEVSAAYCLLCVSIEYPESQDWVIFHLRDDVTFSDGTPMTAHDVAFSHHKLLDEGLPSYAEAVRGRIPKAEALDDYTVKFTFAPDIPRKNLIDQAGGVPVYSKAWFEKTGARLDEVQLEMSPGTGPYMLDSYQINQRIIYRRNPDYWGADLPINKGRHNFDAIRIEYFADSDAAFEAFTAGAYTFRVENTSLTWATRYDFPALEKGWVVKEEPADGNLPAAVGFVYNLRRPILQDIRVRQAIGLMYNFDWTNKTLQYGVFDRLDSYWQGSELEAKGLPEGRELELLEEVRDQIDPAVFTEPVPVSHESDPDRQQDRGNLRRASRLLDDAGWEVGADGMRRKDGRTLDIELLGSNPGFDRIFSPFVQNLKQLGVNVTYNRIDPSQYSQRTNTGTFDYDIIYDGYTNGLEEGTGLAQRLGSEGVGDLFNPAGYSSPAVDKLIKDVIAAKTYDEMAAAVRAVDRLLRWDYPMTLTYYKPTYWLAYYDMYEHPESLPPYALGYLDWWWFNETRYEALRAAGALR